MPLPLSVLFDPTHQHYNGVNNYAADQNASKLLGLFYLCPMLIYGIFIDSNGYQSDLNIFKITIPYLVMNDYRN